MFGSPCSSDSWFLGCGVLLLDVALLLQNTALRYAAAGRALQLQPQRGASMPPLVGVDPSGRRVELAYEEDPRATLILVFSPSCGVCDENWPAWDTLAVGVRDGPVRVAAVDLSGQVTDQYINQHRLTHVPVIAYVAGRDVLAYNLRLTPQTILVAPGGAISGVWTGVLSPGDVSGIRAAIATVAESGPKRSSAVSPSDPTTR